MSLALEEDNGKYTWLVNYLNILTNENNTWVQRRIELLISLSLKTEEGIIVAGFGICLMMLTKSI